MYLGIIHLFKELFCTLVMFQAAAFIFTIFLFDNKLDHPVAFRFLIYFIINIYFFIFCFWTFIFIYYYSLFVVESVSFDLPLMSELSTSNDKVSLIAVKKVNACK